MDDNYYLDILRYNQGFDEPSKWIEYAKQHNFKKVKATKRTCCPDCNAHEFKEIGQYIYYSQLIRIKECLNCFLVYSDILIGKDTLIKHFESSYKDNHYFEILRKPVFKQIATLLTDKFSYKKEILDVGGAKGHLAKMLKDKNSKYDITVSDLSKTACEFASNHFGLQSLCCGIEELNECKKKYDIILMIDVFYYVEDITKAWDSIVDSLKDDGILIIRIPNKMLWIKLVHFVNKYTKIGKRKLLIDHVNGFNPEHHYLFTRKYLDKRLKDLCFTNIKFIPSVTSEQNKVIYDSVVLNLFFKLSVFINSISFNRINIGLSQLVIAKR